MNCGTLVILALYAKCKKTKTAVMKHVYLRLVFLSLTLPLSCCAHHYVDNEGVEHIMGFVNIKIERPLRETLSGEVISIKTLGFSVAQTPEISFVTLGYSHERSALINDHSLVLGNPLQAIDSIPVPAINFDQKKEESDEKSMLSRN